MYQEKYKNRIQYFEKDHVLLITLKIYFFWLFKNSNYDLCLRIRNIFSVKTLYFSYFLVKAFVMIHSIFNANGKHLIVQYNMVFGVAGGNIVVWVNLFLDTIIILKDLRGQRMFVRERVLFSYKETSSFLCLQQNSYIN